MSFAETLKLPFQLMLTDAPIQVVRLKGFYHEASFVPHRHNFNMLYWTTKGCGEHRIGFRNFTMQPGRVFFLQQNQVHQMVAYPEDGYMVLFNRMYFQGFLNHNPQMEQTGLFDFFNRSPLVDLDETMMHTFTYIVKMLDDECGKVSSIQLVQHYLSILLLYAGKQHLKSNQLTESSVEVDIMRRLKILIEENYKTFRFPAFYGDQLGLTSRKLNEYAMRTIGILVQDMIAVRRLADGEALLAYTDMPFKTIAYDLGFVGASHFYTFFKNHTGLTPTEFRQKFRPIQ